MEAKVKKKICLLRLLNMGNKNRKKQLDPTKFCFAKFGRARIFKGGWWMPWEVEAMKDVA